MFINVFQSQWRFALFLRLSNIISRCNIVNPDADQASHRLFLKPCRCFPDGRIRKAPLHIVFIVYFIKKYGT